jgi:hypothetical protein
MKRSVLAIAVMALAFCLSAWAGTDCGKGNEGNNPGGGSPNCSKGGKVSVPVSISVNPNISVAPTTTSVSSSTSNSASTSTSSATGGNASATGGNASASQTATGGNASNGPQSNQQVSNYDTPRQAPPATAPEALSTASCRIAGSVGASSPFGGVALGGSKMDNECNIRETAFAFSLIGDKEAAHALLCTTKAAKAAKLATCQK